MAERPKPFSLEVKRMPVFLRSQMKPVLFIHIPKTGGTSFELQMQQLGWRPAYLLNGVHAVDLKFARSSPQHYHAEVLQSLFNLDQFGRIIAMVRDPFERFKSEYRWQLRQAMTDMAPSRWTDKVLCEYERNPCVYDNHIRPQCSFLVPGAIVFRLENNGVERALRLVNGSSDMLPFSRASLLKSWPKQTVKSLELDEEFQACRSRIEEFYKNDMSIPAI